MPSISPIKAELDETESLNLVFAALSDPIRREIQQMLDGQQLLVSELAQPFSVSIQAISQQIQVLVKAGLVSQQRTGRVSRCQLHAGPIESAAGWINQYSKYWQNQFETSVAFLPAIDEENLKTSTIATQQFPEE